MDILSKLPERLKELMQEREIKAPALAKILGIGHNTLTRYLKGTSIPKFEILIALLNYFDCSADFLLGLCEYPKREGQIFKPVPPFCEQFRIAMQKCNMTQYRLQKKTKISWSNFNEWLNGTNLPATDSLVRIATGLDCTVDFLLGRED